VTKSTHMWNPVRHDLRLMRTKPIGQNDMLVYTDATARDAALPNPVEGMVCGLEDSDAGAIYLDSYWRGMMPVVLPSGDTSGATDQANIQAVLDDHGAVQLVAGTYYTDDTITLDSGGDAIVGAGTQTYIEAVNDTFAVIKVTESNCRVQNLTLNEGEYSLDLDGATYNWFSDIYFRSASSHGIYLHNGVWGTVVHNSSIAYAGGDGINAISTATHQNGNSLKVTNTRISSCTGLAIKWSANDFTATGNVIEGNTGGGLEFFADANYGARGGYVAGNRFEDNDGGHIRFHRDGGAIQHITCVGNYVGADTDEDCFVTEGGSSSSATIRYLTLHSNDLAGSGDGGTYRFNFGDTVWYSYIDTSWEPTETVNITNPEENYLVRQQEDREPRTVKYTVDCSSTVSGSTVNLLTLPAGAVMHEVAAVVTTSFNGTTEFDIGDGSTADLFIDRDDLGAGGAITADEYSVMTDQAGSHTGTKAPYYAVAATTVTATVTNTASATAGEVDVFITYSLAPVESNAVAAT